MSKETIDFLSAIVCWGLVFAIYSLSSRTRTVPFILLVVATSALTIYLVAVSTYHVQNETIFTPFSVCQIFILFVLEVISIRKIWTRFFRQY